MYYLPLQIFFDINFRFQSKVCDGYHNQLQIVMCFNEVAILSMKMIRKWLKSEKIFLGKV